MATDRSLPGEPQLRARFHRNLYRGRGYTVDFLPKIKIEIVLPDDLLESAAAAVTQGRQDQQIGDGKPFILEVSAPSGSAPRQETKLRFGSA